MECKQVSSGKLESLQQRHLESDFYHRLSPLLSNTEHSIKLSMYYVLSMKLTYTCTHIERENENKRERERERDLSTHINVCGVCLLCVVFLFVFVFFTNIYSQSELRMSLHVSHIARH